MKNNIEFVRIGENNWYIFNTKQINKNIITPEIIYADTVSVKIEKERVNSEEEFKSKMKENEEQVKNFGGKIITKKKIAKDGYIVYKYEINAPKLNFKFFNSFIKINKKIYSLSTTVNSNTSLKQKKEKIKILNEILKTIKIKNTHSFYYKISKDILTKKNALEDLEEMRRVLNINPALYLYRSKEETDNEFMKLREEIEKKEKWEKRELYMLFAKFISGINDGHTIMLFDFSEIENPFLLPVIIRNNKVYISKIIFILKL